MPEKNIHPILRFIRKLKAAGEFRNLPDCQLLQRFAVQRDEAAFAMLMHRHGALVWRVCRTVLGECHTAEDAFQATFLILVRKAGSIRKPELLGNWLYGVAHRVALRARKTISRRRAHECQTPDIAAVPAADTSESDDLRLWLQDELQRLPAKYRSPMVLCHLQGHTNEEAARQLQLPVGTVKVRLMRGRDLLRARLVRRGFALSTAALGSALSADLAVALPPALAETTTKAALMYAAGSSTATAVLSAQAVALTQGVLKAMLWTPSKIVTAVLVIASLLGGGLLTVRMMPADAPALTQAKPQAPPIPLLADGARLQAKVKTDVEKLQGTWNLVTFVSDGMALQGDFIKDAKIFVNGETFTSEMGGTYKGTFKVDVSKSPKTLDIIFTEGPEKGKTTLGIYELDGDTWKICLNVSGKERPKEFATKAGSGHALETLSREQAAKGEEAVKKDMAFLQGEWSMVSGEIGGQAMPEAFAKTAKRTAKGNETTVMMNGQLFMKATFKIDPSKKPKTIDYAMTDGLSKGKTQYGIYEIDSNTVRFCFGAPAKDRPADFTTKAGDDRTLSVWRKLKE